MKSEAVLRALYVQFLCTARICTMFVCSQRAEQYVCTVQKLYKTFVLSTDSEAALMFKSFIFKLLGDS